MNYKKLVNNLHKYGRDNNFAYVCDSYKPYLRQDKSYRQWKRVLDKAIFKSFTDKEKKVLKTMFECKVTEMKYISGLI